jgi:hypothetical protein
LTLVIELASAIAKRIRPLTDDTQKVFHGGVVMVLSDKDAALVGKQSIRQRPDNHPSVGARLRLYQEAEITPLRH